jgi:hypothetical protein
MSIMLWAEKLVTNPLWGGIASLLTIIGIIFAAVYWWVLRRQELRQQRWNQYQQTISLAWGSGPNDQGVPAALQIAAVYQLAEFKEFAYMTAFSLKYVVVDNPVQTSPKWKEFVGPHVERVIKLLQHTRAYKNQAKKFTSQ